jgi:class 3 adenylate cyclase
VDRSGDGGWRAERRVVTAMFVDLVGSTALVEALDAEDARELLGRAIRVVVECVEGLGGTVKDLAGDGVLALFGAPVAHEDDAERAVLCGLRASASRRGLQCSARSAAVPGWSTAPWVTR